MNREQKAFQRLFGNKPAPAAKDHQSPDKVPWPTRTMAFSNGAIAKFEEKYGVYFCMSVDSQLANLLPRDSNNGPLGRTEPYFLAFCAYAKLSCHWL